MNTFANTQLETIAKQQSATKSVILRKPIYAFFYSKRGSVDSSQFYLHCTFTRGDLPMGGLLSSLKSHTHVFLLINY